MKYLFIFICLLACVWNSFGEMEFDLSDILHKKEEPKPEPEPEPIHIKPMPKFKYSFHDDHDDHDDDDHWGHKKPKKHHLFIDHSQHINHMPSHHEEEDNWWMPPKPKPEPKKEKKKSFIPKEVKKMLGKDFMPNIKKLVPDLGLKKK